VSNSSDDDKPSSVQGSVTATVTASGSCGSLSIAYDPGHADGAGYQPHIISFGGGGTATIASPGGPGWTDGRHSIRLFDGATNQVVDTRILTVH